METTAELTECAEIVGQLFRGRGGLGVLENAKRDSSFLVREGRVSVCPQRKKTFWYSAEADSVQSESGLWHLRGAEGDRLTERSEERKLPQLEPRALATLW